MRVWGDEGCVMEEYSEGCVCDGGCMPHRGELRETGRY